MLNLATVTWVFFGIWLVAGFAIYFAYGQRHSRLAGEDAVEPEREESRTGV
jgi:APA family basic amino acid/polyamine antiporter